MYVFSERHKIVNAIIPVADAWDANPVVSDIVHLENYKKCTFLIVTGATSAVTPQVRVFAGVSNAVCATPIVFKYRTQAAAAVPGVGSDIPTALTDATVAGFAMLGNIVGGISIVEVDAAVVAAAGANFDHCALEIDENADTAQTGCVIAILSEPRYPQDILATAID